LEGPLLEILILCARFGVNTSISGRQVMLLRLRWRLGMLRRLLGMRLATVMGRRVSEAVRRIE
jgi:hypothetical protein